MSQVDSELATSSPDFVRLSQLKRSLEEKLETLNLLDAEVLELVEEEAVLADEIEQADDFKGTIYAATIKAERRDQPMLPSSGRASASSAGAIGAHGGAIAARINHVKLPKLTLRSFSGDITQWLTSWDSSNRQSMTMNSWGKLTSLTI